MNNERPRHLLLIDPIGWCRRRIEARVDGHAETGSQAVAGRIIEQVPTLLRELGASHCLIAADGRKTNWRHAILASYRTERTQLEQVIGSSNLDEMLTALSEVSTVVSLPEYEARDVVATACTHWLAGARGKVTLLSCDKSLYPLVSEQVQLYDPMQQSVLDSTQLHARYEVAPAQMHAWIALTGDPGRGIAGVAGIGRKTASRLLDRYGSLPAIMAGAGILQDRIGKSLRASAQDVEHAMQVLALRTDVTLGITWNQVVSSNMTESGRTVDGHA